MSNKNGAIDNRPGWAQLQTKVATLVAAGFAATLVMFSVPASALEPIEVGVTDTALDITDVIDLYEREGNSLQISTAPDVDGIVRRIEVRARESNGLSRWAVFALANRSNEQIDRLVVAPHYRLVGSGLLWPDLGAKRIASITPSEGFSLDRRADSEADVFFITLDPGAVVTFVAEQKVRGLPKLYLWQPDLYKDTVNSFTLYRGIVLGIAGLLAVFLTILFVVKGSAMFPATAGLAWGVLAYVVVDFGFWNKIIEINEDAEQIWRAGTEVFLAASLVIFLYAYLNLNRWHAHFSTVAIAWLLGLLILFGVAVAEPSIAAGIARLSFAMTGFGGGVLIALFSLRRFDRAIMLIPAWLLILAWIVGAWLTVTGNLANDIVQPALGGGMVLIVLLIGFTVMQHAFAGGGLAQSIVSDVERQALALTGSGDIVWDWDVIRDVIYTGPQAAQILRIAEAKLNGPPRRWLEVLHPNDRDRFRTTLDAVVEHRRGRISQSFRLRSEDGHFYWFRLKARPVLGADGEVVRCIGSLADVTDVKTAEERMLRDAVHDNLTGLENRELFTNRLEVIMIIAARDRNSRPSLFHINIDRFNDINAELGYPVGDTILLTVARRLSRLLKTGDSLARLAGDQFLLLLVSEQVPGKIAMFAESIRTTLTAPLTFAGEDVKLTGSIGIVTWTAEHNKPEEMLRDAEIAMHQARRFGGNRIEPFRPAFRNSKSDHVIMEEDLRLALDRGEISVVYQPIVRLSDRVTAGYETLVRWRHPKLGNVSPVEFIPIAERSGLINQLGMYVLETACRDFALLEADINGRRLFASVNISSRELLRHDLVTDIRTTLKKTELPAECLKIELTESLVMENPEYSGEVLHRIKRLGVGLSLDDFGTGYSSLSYLMRFPFDTIKIDRSFVHYKERNERSVVMRSIVAMAHGLNQMVVAEGVENESDVVELLQLGCEFAQGYYFGDAGTIEDVQAMMHEELETMLAQ